MITREQIVNAVAAHAAWKVRLGQGIAQKKFDVRSVEAKRDDACEFGKWLRSPEASGIRSDAHFRKANELHARFHQAVGECIAEVERGHITAARSLLDEDVTKASRDLTREMMAWNLTIG